KVRWLNDALEPLSDWQSAVTWAIAPVAPSVEVDIAVDLEGRALVLTFEYPPSFGLPPGPSLWKFSARWMGKEGPLTDVFAPVVPKFVLDGEVFWSAGWGTLLPLPGGGFAAFRDPRSGVPNGTTSPSGW